MRSFTSLPAAASLDATDAPCSGWRVKDDD
jgi:hypothetical protein